MFGNRINEHFTFCSDRWRALQAKTAVCLSSLASLLLGFLHSSKHVAGTHNKPFIKACFWSRFEKTKVAIWSWICLCVCERDRREREGMRASELQNKGKNLVSSVLSHISRVQRLVPATKRFPETIYWMTVGMNWAGIFWHCEFPDTFSLSWAM